MTFSQAMTLTELPGASKHNGATEARGFAWRLTAALAALVILTFG